MKRKVMAILLVLAMVSGLAACSKVPSGGEASTQAPAPQTTAQAVEETEMESAEETAAPEAQQEAPAQGTFKPLTKEELEAIKPAKFGRKAITYIAPYSAGGAADLVGRKLAAIAGEKYGVDVVVENVVGGSGTIGVLQCLTSNPDGYTVSLLNAAFMGQCIQGRLDIDWEKDMTVLCKEVEDVLGIYVKADGDVNTWEKFADKVKNNPPGTVTMGLAGTLSANHACVLALGEAFGDKNIFTIPIYGGAARSITEIIGGHCDATVCKPADCINQLKNGEVVCIAYFANNRVEAFPDVPTVQEFFPDVVMWGDPDYMATYLITNAGVDEEIVNYLTQLFVSCIMDEDFQKLAAESGFQAINVPTGEDAFQAARGLYSALVEMNNIFADAEEGVNVQ